MTHLRQEASAGAAIMRCASGRDVDLALPTPASISLRDIAHHLATINRFSGAPAIPYSVAQHSLVVMRIVEQLHGEPLVALQALLHDAHEAYTNDVPTPTQKTLAQGEAALKAVQQALDIVIFLALGIPAPSARALWAIKQADAKAFATEWRAMMPGEVPDGYPAPANFNVTPWPWHQAEEKFLKEYDRLSLLAGVHPPRIPNLPTGLNK